MITASPIFDLLLQSEQLRTLIQPKTVVQIGGHLTSKRLLTFLSQAHPFHFFRVANSPERVDPHHNQGTQLDTDTAGFCEEILKNLKLKSTNLFS